MDCGSDVLAAFMARKATVAASTQVSSELVKYACAPSTQPEHKAKSTTFPSIKSRNARSINIRVPVRVCRPDKAFVDLLNKCTESTTNKLMQKFHKRFVTVDAAASGLITTVLFDKMLFHPQFIKVYVGVLLHLFDMYTDFMRAMIQDRLTATWDEITRVLVNGHADWTNDTFRKHAHAKIDMILHITKHRTDTSLPPDAARTVFDACTECIRCIDSDDLTTDNATREFMLRTCKHVSMDHARIPQGHLQRFCNHVWTVYDAYDNKCRFIAMDLLKR
jgi:hypothetical protein